MRHPITSALSITVSENKLVLTSAPYVYYLYLKQHVAKNDDSGNDKANAVITLHIDLQLQININYSGKYTDCVK